MHELQVRVGIRIAAARRARNLSQRDLSLLVGSATRTIQTWEAGQRHPRPDALARVAAATGRPVSWFYEVEPDQAAA
jgi:transcriptional regulator with XRE-family HTH domain